LNSVTVEQAGVVNGHRRLVSKAGQQIAVGVAKDAAGHTVISVETPIVSPLILAWCVQNGAQLVTDDTVLGGEASSSWALIVTTGSPCLGHAANNAR
jgi:hypothetical protein